MRNINIVACCPSTVTMIHLFRHLINQKWGVWNLIDLIKYSVTSECCGSFDKTFLLSEFWIINNQVGGVVLLHGDPVQVHEEQGRYVELNAKVNWALRYLKIYPLKFILILFYISFYNINIIKFQYSSKLLYAVVQQPRWQRDQRSSNQNWTLDCPFYRKWPRLWVSLSSPSQTSRGHQHIHWATSHLDWFLIEFLKYKFVSETARVRDLLWADSPSSTRIELQPRLKLVTPIIM